MIMDQPCRTTNEATNPVSSHRSAESFYRRERLRQTKERLAERVYEYKRVGYDRRPMTFLRSGVIARGAGGLEIFWEVQHSGGNLVLNISSEEGATCSLKQ